jgi:hypothetical protein
MIQHGRRNTVKLWTRKEKYYDLLMTSDLEVVEGRNHVVVPIPEVQFTNTTLDTTESLES